MYQHILCPIDGSETSNSGILEAIQLAKTFHAQLRFLYVVDLYFPVTSITGELNVVYIGDALREHGQKALQQAEIQAKDAGITSDCKIVETYGKRVASLILEEASIWPANLIVMGTHGLRGIERIVIGSDADSVVRECKVPVLLVKGPKK